MTRRLRRRSAVAGFPTYDDLAPSVGMARPPLCLGTWRDVAPSSHDPSSNPSSMGPQKPVSDVAPEALDVAA